MNLFVNYLKKHLNNYDVYNGTFGGDCRSPKYTNICYRNGYRFFENSKSITEKYLNATKRYLFLVLDVQ